MNNAEFTIWLRDLSARLPSIGTWVSKFSDETIHVWTEALQGELSLDDCVAANVAILSGELIIPTPWDRIPAVVAKFANDRRYQRIELAKREKSTSEIKHVERSRPAKSSLVGASRDLVDFQSKRRLATGGEVSKADGRERKLFGNGRVVGGETITDQERREFIERWFDEHEPSDDQTAMQAVTCVACLDSGYVTRRDCKSRPIAGHCHCDIGLKRQHDHYNNNKRIGPGVPPTANQSLAAWNNER